jgi:hypothetical protein
MLISYWWIVSTQLTNKQTNNPARIIRLLGLEVGQSGIKFLTFRHILHLQDARLAEFTFNGWSFRNTHIPFQYSVYGTWGGEIFRTYPDFPYLSRFSAPGQIGHLAQPASSTYSWYRVSFSGVKRPGRGVDHPHNIAPRLKKKYSYIAILLGLHGLFCTFLQAGG